MQTISLERQMARIMKVEEAAAERASTISRPTEEAVIRSLDEGKPLVWEYRIEPLRVHYSVDYFTRRLADRHCEKCHQRKPLSDFASATYSYDGLAFWCERCQNNQRPVKWSDRVAESLRGVAVGKAA